MLALGPLVGVIVYAIFKANRQGRHAGDFCLDRDGTDIRHAERFCGPACGPAAKPYSAVSLTEWLTAWLNDPKTSSTG